MEDPKKPTMERGWPNTAGVRKSSPRKRTPDKGTFRKAQTQPRLGHGVGVSQAKAEMVTKRKLVQSNPGRDILSFSSGWGTARWKCLRLEGGRVETPTQKGSQAWS